jgi:hypothetical protein
LLAETILHFIARRDFTVDIKSVFALSKKQFLSISLLDAKVRLKKIFAISATKRTSLLSTI